MMHYIIIITLLYMHKYIKICKIYLWFMKYKEWERERWIERKKLEFHEWQTNYSRWLSWNYHAIVYDDINYIYLYEYIRKYMATNVTAGCL